MLGSTGSIGTQVLRAARKEPDIKIRSLAAGKNAKLLEEQAREFKVEKVALADEKEARALKILLADTSIHVLSGEEGILELASGGETDTAVTAIVGMAGLKPTLAAIDAKKRIALSNKETLVAAGEIVKERAKKSGSEIIPVDSEHSAIFQCFAGCRDKSAIKKLILTASGGPFFGKTRAELEKITPEEALSHPTWNMGAKVTIDSASMMNKGLELIEAMHLFEMPEEKIEVLIHRESIIHSMVEFCDHSVLAQLSTPDMTLACAYGILHPERKGPFAEALDLVRIGRLTFFAPDDKNFPCLSLAREAAQRGGNLPAVLNAANEEAVASFLNGEISFLQIPDIIESVMSACAFIKSPSLEEIFFSDGQARKRALSNISL